MRPSAALVVLLTLAVCAAVPHPSLEAVLAVADLDAALTRHPGPVTITVGSTSQLCLLDSFLFQWYSAADGETLPLVVLALDEASLRMCRKWARGLPVFHECLPATHGHDLDEDRRMHHGSLQFQKLVWLKPLLLARALRLGRSAVVTDLDVVWFKTPSTSRHDLRTIANGGGDDGAGVVLEAACEDKTDPLTPNTGVLAAKADPALARIVDAWLDPRSDRPGTLSRCATALQRTSTTTARQPTPPLSFRYGDQAGLHVALRSLFPNGTSLVRCLSRDQFPLSAQTKSVDRDAAWRGMAIAAHFNDGAKMNKSQALADHGLFHGKHEDCDYNRARIKAMQHKRGAPKPPAG